MKTLEIMFSDYLQGSLDLYTNDNLLLATHDIILVYSISDTDTSIKSP